MDYDEGYYLNYFPVKVNEKFFLGAIEDDFQLDGFRICPINRVKKVKPRDSKCLDININEGVVDQLYTPNVSISGWRQVFRSLKGMNRYLMVDTDDALYVGVIDTVKKHSVIMMYFDADGIWQEESVKIRYKDIQSVTFGSRYVDVFSKYIPRL